MQNVEDISRRGFLGLLGAGAMLGAAGSPRNRGPHVQSSSAWSPAPTLKNPNILLIMVDQMRAPVWLSPSQQSTLNQTVIPNIGGRIQNNAYNFSQYYCAATNCSPARGTLMTGLYPPQSGVYITESNPGVPPLNPAFPTWGQAIPLLNPAYQGNLWWFGKWHLTTALSGSPLLPYGFNTRTYPGGPSPYNPSPNGASNEGTNGGFFQFPGQAQGQVWANDAQIAGDFIGWLQGQAPTTGLPPTPWCATVSLINPHDIAEAPAWMQSGQFPPPNVPLKPIYFPPPSGSPPPFYTELPANWNFEDLTKVTNKPGLQYKYLNDLNSTLGTVTSWVLYLNQYFWLQNFVDQQIGLVLNALAESPYANNTVVIFVSDHGEFAGSHGIHDKGGAVYDEALLVPLSVQFPGQAGSVAMNQMCSSVDFFGLMCDLVSGGSGQWRLAYPDLANRQSLWSFLESNSSETRVAPSPLGLPYVLHTFDEVHPVEGATVQLFGKSHIVSIRTKHDVSAGMNGAKLAFYWEWASCSTLPDATQPDAEFYDYNPQTTNNTSELGNDYLSNNADVQASIAQHTQALGTWGTPGTGIIGNELNRPLVGTGTDGNPLTAAQSAAHELVLTYLNGPGNCP